MTPDATPTPKPMPSSLTETTSSIKGPLLIITGKENARCPDCVIIRNEKGDLIAAFGSDGSAYIAPKADLPKYINMLKRTVREQKKNTP